MTQHLTRPPNRGKSNLPPLVTRAFGAHVESRKSAVAWAMRQRSVSLPRSSNRTCRFPASGFPTGFIVRHTAAVQHARVEGATHRASRTQHHKGTAVCRVLSRCAVCRGSAGRDHRRVDRRLGMPASECHSRSTPTNPATADSVGHAHLATSRCCREPGCRQSSS